MSLDLRKPPTLWALADCNNFYCSCERLIRPDLWNRPVVVLSNNDGCVVARSNEAKALGIKMGVPEFKIRGFLKHHNVAVFSSNYSLYGDLSARVIQAMESLVPTVEQYSIDEAFIPLHEKALAVNAAEVCAAVRARVLRWTGIPVSIGIGETRTLAKLAAERAKAILKASKGKQNGIADENYIAEGVYRLTAGTVACEKVLAETPAGDIWGIGPRSAKRLAERGIHTAVALADAARNDSEAIRRLLTVTGLRTALELAGESCIDMQPAPRQTIIATRSFGRKLSSQDEILLALAANIENAARRLRAAKLEAQGLEVRIRTSPYANDGRYYENAVCFDLPEPTADTRRLLETARIGLQKIFRDGWLYAKSGVLLYNLRAPGTTQLRLWALRAADSGKEKKVMAAIDAVNQKYGAYTLRPAILFDDERASAAVMRRERLSPAWTTDWEELPKVGNGKVKA